MTKRRHLYGTKTAFVSVQTDCMDCGGTGLHVKGGKQMASVYVCGCVEIITGYGISKSHSPKLATLANLPVIAEPDSRATLAAAEGETPASSNERTEGEQG